MPPRAGTRFRNVFTDERLHAEDGRLSLAVLFATFPLALLEREA